MTLKIFISYSSKDRHQVGKLKISMSELGYQVFTAHDDLEPGTKEWDDKIIEHIKNSEVFIAYLTINFKESEWTSQEIGIALSEKKEIIPLFVEIAPYGFIKEIQALKLKEIKETTDKIIKIITQNESLKEPIKDHTINEILNFKSDNTLNRQIILLNLFEMFTKEQIINLKEFVINNKRIYINSNVRETFSKIFSKYKEYITSTELDRLTTGTYKKANKKRKRIPFEVRLNQYSRFKQRYSRDPKQSGTLEERDLYNWSKFKRIAFWKGELKEEEIQKLKDAGFWFNIEKKRGRSFGSKDKFVRKIDGYFGSKNAKKEKD